MHSLKWVADNRTAWCLLSIQQLSAHSAMPYLVLSAIRRENFIDSSNVSTSASTGAVQRGRGAGIIKLAFDGPALQKPVDKAGMEEIPGAGGIDGRDSVGRPLNRLLPVPGQHAPHPQGDTRQAAMKLLMQHRQ